MRAPSFPSACAASGLVAQKLACFLKEDSKRDYSNKITHEYTQSCTRVLQAVKCILIECHFFCSNNFNYWNAQFF
ncbi:hypothetical protein NXF25_010303 [Crotalus adamanteus]|uniref:Uncharacterized protein n=1 Tax=Crotalus adamanteus TaxID=8729 RepID=A0AAW1BJ06_CROAD